MVTLTGGAMFITNGGGVILADHRYERSRTCWRGGTAVAGLYWPVRELADAGTIIAAI